jgi:hypothetical protein
MEISPFSLQASCDFLHSNIDTMAQLNNTNQNDERAGKCFIDFSQSKPISINIRMISMRKMTKKSISFLLTASCFMLHASCFLLPPSYFLLTVYRLLFIVYCLLFIVCWLLSSVHCLLFTVYCSLFIVHCSLFTVYCLLLRTLDHILNDFDHSLSFIPTNSEMPSVWNSLGF